MRASANGIEIEYETFGDAGNEVLLLIMGLGGQLTLWDDEFCEMLAERGFFLIRYDNRDVGLSTYFDSAGTPDMMKLMMAQAAGDPPQAPYTIDDMANDAAGLLDALGVDTAHVAGASMGGMIAQTVAIRHPHRVRSLVSIMSNTGNPEAPQGKPEVMAKLMNPPAASREAQIEQSIELIRTIGSPGFPFNEDRARERATRNYDRAFHPQGTARQMAAIVAHGTREDQLRRLKTPTLVIHGADDPLVPVACGRMTADVIPDAELLIIEGMGHDIPPGAFVQIVDAIAAHTAIAEAD